MVLVLFLEIVLSLTPTHTHTHPHTRILFKCLVHNLCQYLEYFKDMTSEIFVTWKRKGEWWKTIAVPMDWILRLNFLVQFVAYYLFCHDLNSTTTTLYTYPNIQLLCCLIVPSGRCPAMGLQCYGGCRYWHLLLLCSFVFIRGLKPNHQTRKLVENYTKWPKN